MTTPHKPRILLLSGPRRVGKTTLCGRWIAQAQAGDWRLGGILAPGRWDRQGNKVGIDALDLATGARRELATIVPYGSETTIGEYRFCAKTTQWALDCILQALEQPLDLVVIDEIGRLELLRGGGFAPAIQAIPRTAARRVLIIVRDTFAERLAARLAPLPCERITVSPEKRDALAEQGPALLH